MSTRQSCLVQTTVSEYKGDKFDCCKSIGTKDNGKEKICENTASFVVDSVGQKRKFYCGIHTRDIWKEMADNSQ